MIIKQLEKAPAINDTILIQRFKKFKDDPVNFNNSNDNNNDDDNNKPDYLGPAPPSPTANGFQDLLYQPPLAIFSQSIFDQSQPNLCNKPIFLQLQQQQQQPKNAFDRVGSAPITPGEQVMSEIEHVVEKAKHEEEVEQITPADPLLEYFNKADEILKTDFVWQKEQEKSEMEAFKKEYQVDALTDQIDQGQVPKILERYFGGANRNFLQKINSLKPNQETSFFTDFLMADFASRLMKENNLFIHIESGDLYYNGTNTVESIYDFVLAQNDFSKKIVK